MKEYQYEYEWDREYCYPESNVLRNRLNIRNSADLSAAERSITSLKIAAAKQNPIQGQFNFSHLQRIHKYVFEDVFDWAGEMRHVNIAKGNQFCLTQNIDLYAEGIFRKLYQEHYLIGADNTAERLAWYLSEINVLHLFREGNGRAQRLFIEYLAYVAGYKIDFSSVSPEEMIIASAESFACMHDRINEMFYRITMPIEAEKQQAWIEYFFGKRSEAMRWYQFSQK